MILTTVAALGKTKRVNDVKTRIKEERKDNRNQARKNALSFLTKEVERAKMLAKKRSENDREIISILFDKDEGTKTAEEDEPKFLKSRHDEDEE